MNYPSIITGALRYEFGMQIRRRSVWIVLGLLSVMLFALWKSTQGDMLMYGHPTDRHTWVAASGTDAIIFWAEVITFLLPVGVGLVLADRLARDHTTHVDEIFDTLPGPLSARLIGKYLGSTLATLTPVLLCYAAGIAYIMSHAYDPSEWLLSLETFAAVLLPGSLFAAGFSIAIPVALKTPVYQFLFTGYWFWANLMSPRFHIPNLSATILNAAGPYAIEGIFHFDWTFLSLNPTPIQVTASITLLIGLGWLAIAGAWGYLHWQHTQR